MRCLYSLWFCGLEHQAMEVKSQDEAVQILVLPCDVRNSIQSQTPSHDKQQLRMNSEKAVKREV